MARREAKSTDSETYGLPQPMRLYDIEKFKPRPDFYILGNGLLRRGALTLLISYTGMGKTILSIQLAVAIATGKPVFGLVTKRPSDVLYIQSENDEDTIKRDVLSIAEHMNAPKSLLQKNFRITPPFLAADNGFAAAFDVYTEEHAPDLVVVDHYQSYTDGDLNSTATFKKWITPLNKIIRTKERHMGLLTVVHMGKPSEEKKGYTHKQGVYKATGSSIQANWSRTAMTLEPTSTPGVFELGFVKGYERSGLMGPDNMPLERIFLRDSRDPNKPWWERCEENEKPCVVDYDKVVREGLEKWPDLGQRVLAGRLKISRDCLLRHLPRGCKKWKRKEKEKR
jgi:hypothetical protein